MLGSIGQDIRKFRLIKATETARSPRRTGSHSEMVLPITNLGLAMANDKKTALQSLKMLFQPFKILGNGAGVAELENASYFRPVMA